MFYLALASPSFRKSSLEELGKVARFSIVDEFIATWVIKTNGKRFAEKLLEKNPVFIYNILQLKSPSRIKEPDYLNSLYDALGTLPKTKGIKIECFDVNCKTNYSAKDIEVYLGQRLEKEGYDINITDPDILVYLVLINGSCYVGHADYKKMKKKFVNPERHYHTYSKEAVSRSELKLMQAFDEFGVSGSGIAIDMGAAPGGWSNLLARYGYKVIAIDNGDLDYKRFKELGMNVKVIRKPDALQKAIEKNDIVHLRSSAKNARLGRAVKADLIVNDMNMASRESAEAVASFSRNLAKGAGLIMTVKCVDRKAEKHISNAREALGGNFKVIGVKVLPSNRQELTLYAKAANN